MKPTTALRDARWHQARGTAKETWGWVSGRNATRLEGRVERLTGVGEEKLLRTEAQARAEIESAVQRGQQNIRQLTDSLASTADRVLGRPGKPRSSWIWIPALGGAVVLAGLSLAMFTPNGPLRDAIRNQEWWGKLSTPRAWLKTG